MLNPSDSLGSKVPNLRFPGFEGEWETKTLGEISQLITKGTTPKKFTNQGIKYIKIESFKENSIDIEKCMFIDEITHNKELKRSILREGDILFAIAGATIGKTNIVTKAVLPANTNQALAIIRLNEKEVKSYIIQILKSAIMQKYIKESISVGAQPNLNLEQINSFSFCYPNIEEQKKIASFLSLINERIITQNKIIEELEQLIKGLCINLILKKVPNTKLNQCVICNTSSLTESEVINQKGTHPVYGATGIISYTADYQIDKDAILIIKDGSGVGKVQYATNKFSVIGTLNYLTIKSQVNLRYILYSLKFFNFEKYKVGSGIPHIYFKDYGEALIYCPSLAEQYKIEGLLSSIDKKIEIEKQNLNQLNLQKQFLLKELII
ncbi:restriction endonuclease subunit S [Myroides odoratimimus]|nr:restriction endonuclease subunit S [Myroides odoratimimus]